MAYISLIEQLLMVNLFLCKAGKHTETEIQVDDKAMPSAETLLKCLEL